MALNEKIGDGLNSWMDKVKHDVVTQRKAIKMRTDPNDTASREKMQPYLEKAVRAIERLESQSVQAREFIKRERKQHERLVRVQRRAQQQAARVALIRERLPDHVSAALDAILANSAAAAAAVAASVPAAQPSPVPENRYENQREPAFSPKAELKLEPVPEPEPEDVTSQRTSVSTRRKGARADTPPSSTSGSPRGEFPEVEFVTAKQLKSAPQYVKGRLTVDKITPVVERLNSFLRTKYTILRKNRRDLRTDAERDMAHMFQESECPETEDKEFVTDLELKKLSDFKMDATARSAINVLRHVGSLKEVRGKNKARIFIVRGPDC